MLEVREFEVRETATATREFEGIAVPFGQVANVGGYKESFARGSVDAEGAILYWRHEEPIGVITSGENMEDGFHIKARISETSLGNDAYTLLRDGVVNKLSVGFEPIEHREEKGVTVRTKVRVREVSLVPFPAYAGAEIQEVRSEPEEEYVMTDVITNADLENVRESVEVLERKFSALEVKDEAPVLDTRSAGEVIKGIARGEEAEIRAYTGGTTADAVMQKAWIGDLSRIVNENAPLRSLFSSAALPSAGMQIEYAQFKSNTLAVEEVAEGADLPFGKISKETKYADVKLYGGYTQLTRLEIERSSVEMLNASLQLMAVEVGKRLNTVMKSDYSALVTAQAANKVDVAVGTEYLAWLEATVDAADKFAANGLGLDALVVGKADFKKLLNLVDVEGRPVFAINGAGNNTIGNLDVTGIGGRLVNVPVVYVPGLTADPAFVNKSAIKMFTSPVVSLQDENIINFSKDFSVYMFAAIADLFPQGIVPVDVVA